ncbi:MAG: hypothetical protein IJ138_10810 [Clostridia bacterium]|nr:hypothetical protein [Clostridia bacterium]
MEQRIGLRCGASPPEERRELHYDGDAAETERITMEREANAALTAKNFARARWLYAELLERYPQQICYGVCWLDALTEGWNPKRRLTKQQRTMAERLVKRMLRQASAGTRPMAAASATKWNLLTALWDRQESKNQKE